MPTGFRSFVLPAATVAYVCFASLRGQGGITAWLALIGLPVALALVWRRTDTPREGEDHTARVSRQATRALAWGAALWLAARAGVAGRPSLDAAANLGTGTAAVAVLVAIARIPSLGGLLAIPKAARSLDAAAFAGVLWGIATALPATRALLPAQTVRLDPLAIDYATTTAGAGSLLVLVAATWRARTLRRLELGAGDRLAGALALALTAFAVAIPASLLDVAAPDRVLPMAVLLAAAACTWAATTREPTTVSSALRGVLALLILGAPVTLLTGFLARQVPDHAGAIVLMACTASVVVGLIARAVARPLGPEQSRWLDAIESASRGALQPEPDAAIRASLMALNRATGSPTARPELWRLNPDEVLSVDIAGYLHTTAQEAPERLLELAQAEPERTLRAEVLKAIEVRRPEARPLLSWFESRGAFSATLILDEDGPLGFVLLPGSGRSSSMTLEEARAVRVLADRISALIAVSAALARSRQRELAASTRAEAADDEVHRLEHVVALDEGRHRATAERAARAVRTTAFSPAARFTLDELQRLARMNAPLTLRAPLGVDRVGYAAVAHLASPRSGGPFVVVDGAAGAEHELSLWQDPGRSPLELSDGGTLVLLDAAALPLAIQQHVARVLSRRASTPERSAVLPGGIVATAPAPLSELLETGRLDAGLARWLGGVEVALPSLAQRAEDLRSLVLETLARAGLRRRGQPLGVATSALRLLTEHRWPGNEAELIEALERAAAVAEGDAVTAEDLATSGFRPELDLGQSETPLPVAPRRRGRPRRPLRRS